MIMIIFYENNLLFTAFLPFGIGNGDTVGPRQIDASTDPVQLNLPIVFYYQEQTELFVSFYSNPSL